MVAGRRGEYSVAGEDNEGEQHKDRAQLEHMEQRVRLAGPDELRQEREGKIFWGREPAGSSQFPRGRVRPSAERSHRSPAPVTYLPRPVMPAHTPRAPSGMDRSPVAPVRR